MSYYYANVANNMIEYFEKKLKEREDRIRVVSKNTINIDPNGVIYTQYILEAEEGLIDARWKL